MALLVADPSDPTNSLIVGGGLITKPELVIYQGQAWLYVALSFALIMASAWRT